MRQNIESTAEVTLDILPSLPTCAAAPRLIAGVDLSFLSNKEIAAGWKTAILSSNQNFRILVKPLITTPDLKANALHSWRVEVQRIVNTDGELVKLYQEKLKGEFIMPMHGHGLATDPQISKDSEGETLIKGIKFNMPGKCDLSGDVADLNGCADSYSLKNIAVKP